MHGTFVQHRPLQKDVGHIIKDGEIITFGIEVTRGQGTFTTISVASSNGPFYWQLWTLIKYLVPSCFGKVSYYTSDSLTR